MEARVRSPKSDFRIPKEARNPNARRPFRWVAQATRLSRAATRRSERGSASEFFRRAVSIANRLSVPPGQWPNGTGKLPVPPNFVAEIGFKTRAEIVSVFGI